MKASLAPAGDAAGNRPSILVEWWPKPVIVPGRLSWVTQMLDAAGWKQSGAYRTKGGKTLSLRFVIPTGVAASKQEGELTQAMLKGVLK